MRNILLFFILILIAQISICNAQASAGNPWVSVINKTNADLRVDISTMKYSAAEGEIYIWGLDTYNDNLKMEDIEKPIHRIKTYYLINPELMRYSILEVVYYDSLNKEIKSFNYRKKSEDPVVKYNFPILKGSSLEAILNKCREYIKTKK